jgi:hypothetical protein
MTHFKRHMGRRVAGVGVAVALVVLGLAAPAYAAIPTITSMLPVAPSPGCEATITGANYQTPANGGPLTTVTFNQGSNKAGTLVSVDADTQAEVGLITTPALTAGTATTLLVHSSGGTGGDSATFAFNTGASATCPGVPAFTPTSGAIGSTVTITGSFVTAPTAVRFNTTLATPTASSASSVTVAVPTGATTGPIHVYTAAGQKTSTTSFTVVPVPAPTITTFTPTFGSVGTSVKITGTNFSGTAGGTTFTTSSVKFNTTSATTFHVDSATQITATVPTGATTGKISVTTPGGTATSATNFTVSNAHSRSVTLSLKKHLVAKGVVSVGDGFTACVASVPVKIQRRVSGSWKAVGSTTTTASGSYSKKVKDKTGKYRAKAPKVTLNAGVDVCKGAKSPVRKHTH